MQLVLVVVLATCFALIASSVVFDLRQTDVASETFDMEGRRRVRIEVDAGDVTVRGTSSPLVQVVRHAQYSVAPVLNEGFDGDTLALTARTRPRRFGHQVVDYVVEVPADTDVTIDCPCGHVDVSGVAGRVELVRAASIEPPMEFTEDEPVRPGPTDSGPDRGRSCVPELPNADGAGTAAALVNLDEANPSDVGAVSPSGIGSRPSGADS